MPGKNLIVVVKVRGSRGKVRKRGTFSSSFMDDYKLKRVFLVGKRAVPLVPLWKLTDSRSWCHENEYHVAGKGGTAKRVSARKLAANLWKVNRLPSPTVEEKKTDPFKDGWQPRTESASFQKLLEADCGWGEVNSLNNCLVEVDRTQDHVESVLSQIIGSRTHIEDVYRNMKTSKDLLKLLRRTWHIEQQNLTSTSLFSALKFELESACAHLNEYISGNESNWRDIEVLLKQFAEEKSVWRIKAIRRKKQLEVQMKLTKQTERFNKKLGKELAETKASLLRATQDLEREKSARGIFQQVRDGLAEGVGEDEAEVGKAREMPQFGDILSKERVETKLLKAQSQLEEKSAAVDEFRNELETFLQWKKQGEEDDGGSPSSETIKALEKHLRETLPCLTGGHVQEMVNKRDGEWDDSEDSDLHCIELNVDEISKSCDWNDSETKRKSEDKSLASKFMTKNIKRPTDYSETKFADDEELESTMNKPKSHDVLDAKGLFEFISRSWRNSK